MAKRHWQDFANALIGLWISASPFVLGTGAQRAEAIPFWSLWAAGAAVLVFSLLGRSWSSLRKERVMAGLGAVVVLAPMLWRSEPFSALACSSMISGLVVMGVAGWIALEAHYLEQKRSLSKDDMRADLPELAMPDESLHMAGGWLGPDRGPDIVSPGPHVQGRG